MKIGELAGLPPGKYVVTAKARFDVQSENPSQVFCSLTLSDAHNVGGPFIDESGATVPGASTTTLPLSAAADLPSGGTAVLRCVGDDVSASNVKVTAIQVGLLMLTIVP